MAFLVLGTVKYLPGGLFQNFIHIYPTVAFIVYTFPILNDQHLRGFVIHAEGIFYTVRDIPVLDKVQKEKGYVFREMISFQPALCHAADSTPGAMFKDHLRLLVGLFFDTGQLAQCVQGNPVHQALNDRVVKDLATAGQPVLRLLPQLVRANATIITRERPNIFFIVFC